MRAPRTRVRAKRRAFRRVRRDARRVASPRLGVDAPHPFVVPSSPPILSPASSRPASRSLPLSHHPRHRLPLSRASPRAPSARPTDPSIRVDPRRRPRLPRRRGRVRIRRATNDDVSSRARRVGVRVPARRGLRRRLGPSRVRASPVPSWVGSWTVGVYTDVSIPSARPSLRACVNASPSVLHVRFLPSRCACA